MMVSKKRVKRMISILLVLSSVQFSGCNVVKNNSLFGESNLKENEALKIDEEICSVDVARLFVMDLSNRYKKDFGGLNPDGIKIGDMDFDKFVITKAQNDLSIIYALSALAKKEKITVTDEEQKAIETAAKTYVGELNNKEISFANITEDSVKQLYSNYFLADKYCSKKIENVSETVSDEDARVIKVQYIHIDNNTDEKEGKKILSQVKKQVEGGYQEFLVEASRYSSDKVTECLLYKNKAEKKFETEAFGLQNDQVSEVISDDDGLYLVKCIEAYMETETNKNKAEIVAMNKAALISQGYDEFVKNADKKINEEMWKKIKSHTGDGVDACNLLEIYASIEE